MSKFTALLCTLVFSSVINASEWFPAMRTVQLKTQRMINATIWQAERKFDATIEMEQEISRKFSVKATIFHTKVVDDIALVSLKVNAEIKQIARNAGRVNITNCMNYSDNLTLMVDGARSYVDKCVAYKLNTRLDEIDNINRFFRSESDRLQEIGKHAEACWENLHDVKSAFAALTCTRVAKNKADRTAANFAKSMTTKITMLKSLSIPFRNELNECSHVVDDLYEEASNFVGKVEQCIYEKVHNRRSPSETRCQLNKCSHVNV